MCRQSVTQTRNQRVALPWARPISRHPTRKIYGPDRIGLVGFNDYGFIIARPDEAYSAYLQQVAASLHERVSGTSTNLADGLRKALALIHQTPRGALRRIWLLSDGYPNRETDQILSVVAEARAAWVNINCIGFGDQYDEALLRRISEATHNGHFIPVRTLRQLSSALVAGPNGNGREARHLHRAEVTILSLDLSGSMVMPMEERRKIDVVEEAVLHLLHFKQKCFS